MGSSSSCKLSDGTSVTLMSDNFCNSNCSYAQNNCVLWSIPWLRLLLSCLMLLMALASRWLLYGVFVLIRYVLVAYSRSAWYDVVRRHTFRWTKRLLVTLFIWGAYVALLLPNDVNNVLSHIITIPVFLCLFFWVNAAFTALAELIQLQLLHNAPPGELDQRKTEASAYAEMSRLLKYFVFFLVGILFLESLTLDPLELLQSTTFWSLSVIFALQPWARNLVAGMFIFFDRKFVLGQTVRVVGMQGVVENVTLRNTTLRRDDDSLVFIPNSRLMEHPLSNMTEREKRLLEIRVRVCHDTSASQLREVLRDLDIMLQSLHPNLTSHEGQDGSSFFVALDSILSHECQRSVWTYTDEASDRAHKVIRSEVMLAVTETLEQHGVEPEDGGAFASLNTIDDVEPDDSSANTNAVTDQSQMPPLGSKSSRRCRRRRPVAQQKRAGNEHALLRRRFGGRQPPYSFTQLDDYDDDDIDRAMLSARQLTQAGQG